jgi:hypothetical protein
VDDFFDFFLAWWDLEDFFFLVVVVEGVVGAALSGAAVCPAPAAWAYDWIGNIVPATNVSNANAETSAFMRELLSSK